MNTVIESFSVPFRSFSLHILVSLSIAPEIARQVRDAVVFFRQSSRAVRLYESFDRRRVSLRAFIVTEPFVFRELLFIQCPFCCFFEDFSSASCEIGSTTDPSLSTVFIFLDFKPLAERFVDESELRESIPRRLCGSGASALAG